MKVSNPGLRTPKRVIFSKAVYSFVPQHSLRENVTGSQFVKSLLVASHLVEAFLEQPGHQIKISWYTRKKRCPLA